ncbi:cytochrome c3 family protein [Geomesophilobacter sediminis]|uniref:Cytochrome C n=1 Tax=Geomesophilobacter sediminis TaxID=2798584 RepID=A0A8J7S977_9BACT|nr:cytochrome c3 family protein [Geomesophilobacter sediminis]MBJ6726565.1 cytochrome C [Geomesophilobacter sediminis]
MSRHHLLFLIALALWIPGIATAAESNRDCLGCHGKSSIVKGDQGSYLYINPQQYGATSHAKIGCPSCHVSVSAAHPTDGIRPSRASCQECHGDVMAEYGAIRHAKKAGCSDCHDPHAVKTSASSSGADVNRPCARCHQRPTMIAVHSKWLPQTNLHMEALPCIACHTGSKDYIINLYVESKVGVSGDFWLAPLTDLRRIGGKSDPAALVDRNGDGRVSLEELRQFNLWAKDKGLRVNAMMMPKVMTHTFQTLQNRFDCSFCHASGNKGNQESFVCLPQPDGRYAQIPVQRGAVLELIYGTPDFYMMGATRSKALSIIGGLIVVGGMMMPIGHGTLRFLSRKNRQHHDH